MKGMSNFHRRSESYFPKKALNLNSPEFFPDSSFSSSTDTLNNTSLELETSIQSAKTLSASKRSESFVSSSMNQLTAAI